MGHQTGDKVADKKQAEQEAVERLEFQNDLRAVLETKPGRNVLWWLMAWCGINKSSMTGNNWTYYNEGKRSVSTLIMMEITAANDEAFLRMQRENQAKVENKSKEDKKHGRVSHKT